MWVWDALSLALCNAWRPFTIGDVPTADGLTSIELTDREDSASTLDPWPFSSEQVDVQCEAKRLAHRYKDEDTMRQAFVQAVPVKLNFMLVAS